MKVCRNRGVRVRIYRIPIPTACTRSPTSFFHITQWSNRCFRTNWRKSDGKDKREEEKERVFGVVKLERGTVRTFELLRANIILILFAESGESGKFCPHFAVVRERAFPSSTDNDRNSRRQARSFARFSLLKKFR